MRSELVCAACNLVLTPARAKNPFYCACGNRIDIPSDWQPPAKQDRPKQLPASTCHHRGARLGKMECGCGSVYRCTLLNILCSPKQPVDEWTYAEIDGEKVRLSAEAFRCCRGCADKSG